MGAGIPQAWSGTGQQEAGGRVRTNHPHSSLLGSVVVGAGLLLTAGGLPGRQGWGSIFSVAETEPAKASCSLKMEAPVGRLSLGDWQGQDG